MWMEARGAFRIEDGWPASAPRQTPRLCGAGTQAPRALIHSGQTPVSTGFRRGCPTPPMAMAAAPPPFARKHPGRTDPSCCDIHGAGQKASNAMRRALLEPGPGKRATPRHSVQMQATHVAIGVGLLDLNHDVATRHQRRFTPCVTTGRPRLLPVRHRGSRQPKGSGAPAPSAGGHFFRQQQKRGPTGPLFAIRQPSPINRAQRHPARPPARPRG